MQKEGLNSDGAPVFVGINGDPKKLAPSRHRTYLAMKNLIANHVSPDNCFSLIRYELQRRNDGSETLVMQAGWLSGTLCHSRSAACRQMSPFNISAILSNSAWRQNSSLAVRPLC